LLVDELVDVSKTCFDLVVAMVCELETISDEHDDGEFDIILLNVVMVMLGI
jgi:hypothetical protein